MPPESTEASVLGALTQSVAQMAPQVAVIGNDIGHLKDDVAELGRDVKEALGTLNRQSAEAAASPAGRELLRQLGAHDEELGRHGKRLDAHDGLIDEMRGAVRLLKSGGAIMGLLASLASALVILHSIGIL